MSIIENSNIRGRKLKVLVGDYKLQERERERMSKFDSYRRGGGIFSYWIDAGNQTRVFRLSRQSLSS